MRVKEAVRKCIICYLEWYVKYSFKITIMLMVSIIVMGFCLFRLPSRYTYNDIYNMCVTDNFNIIKGSILSLNALQDSGIDLDLNNASIISIEVNNKKTYVFVKGLSSGSVGSVGERKVFFLKRANLESGTHLYPDIINISYILDMSCFPNIISENQGNTDSLFPEKGRWQLKKDMNLDELYDYMLDFEYFLKYHTTRAVFYFLGALLIPITAMFFEDMAVYLLDEMSVLRDKNSE